MHTIKFCVALTGYVTIVSIAVVIAVSSYDDFTETLAKRQASQPCINHWVSMGVPRRDIKRTGYTCEVNIDSYGY